MKRPLDLLRETSWWRLDPALLTIAAALVSLGLVMVYSASVAVAVQQHYGETYFFVRQLAYGAVGIGALVAMARIPYQRFARLGAPLYVASLLLLLAVLVLGRHANGAQRWLPLGPIPMQPSELMKPALVLLLASLYAQDTRRAKQFKRGFLTFVALALIPVGLVVAEPDLGTSIIISATGLAVFFVGGASLLQLPLLGAAAGGLLAASIQMAPYRFTRFLVFLHPWENSQGVSYQIQQSLLALGSGGLWGLGLGSSRQKFSYLPAPHTDSIFAIIGEELGFVGCLGVILLFVALAWRGLSIARAAPDQFGALLATGITSSLVVQAFINIAAVSASIPFTGVPLPFISYGGTSLIVSLAGIGILLNVAAQALPGAVPVAEPPPARRPAIRSSGRSVAAPKGQPSMAVRLRRDRGR